MRLSTLSEKVDYISKNEISKCDTILSLKETLLSGCSLSKQYN